MCSTTWRCRMGDISSGRAIAPAPSSPLPSARDRAIAEGPLGHVKRGSWLVSGRKSYLDLLVKKLAEEGLSFGFGDAQAKLRYDLSERQSVSLSFITGKSRLKELPEDEADTQLF